MNKIKTLYDLVQTMKEEKIFKGEAKVGVQKDDVSVFSMEKTFEKNLEEGTMKGKMKTEVHHDGMNMKNESEYDFDKTSCRGHRGHHKGFHHGHRGMGMNKKMMEMHGGECHTPHGHSMGMCSDMPHGKGFKHGRGHGFSMRRRLDKFSMLLDLLNRLEIKETEGLGKTLKLQMSLEDLPEDIRKHMMGHMMYNHGQGEHFNDFKTLKSLQVLLDGQIDENNKIKSLNVRMEGGYLDTNDENHTVEIKGEVALV